MPYTTVEEVRNNHERIPSSGEQDATIAMHIPLIDSLVDGYLRGKVQLPFTAIPALIKMAAMDLVTFRTLRSLYSAQVEEYQQWLELYRDPPMELLEDIRSCKISLDSDDATAYAHVQSNTSGKQAIFNLGDPVDQDYHDDDGDDRYGEE